MDQALMMNGAANAVRGSSASTGELLSILVHSGSSVLIVQDTDLLERLAPELSSHRLKCVVVMWGEPAASVRETLGSVTVYSFDEVFELGLPSTAEFKAARPWEKVDRGSLATLVYTSGTTGAPKAAALTHANILYQVENFEYYINVLPGNTVLSLLPAWHIYERAVSYHVLSRGARQIYSIIPRFKNDLGAFKPNFFVCVPLVLDTLHTRVMATLGKLPPLKKAIVNMLLGASRAHVHARRLLNGVSVLWAFQRPPVRVYLQAVVTFVFTALLFKLAGKIVFAKIRKEIGVQTAIVSGGGSLTPQLDDFFEMLDLPVLNGWGLTETSPVLACRRSDDESDPARNVRGTVGHTMPGTTLRLVDPNDAAQEVPAGEQGLVLAKGPGVMTGYYRDEEATAGAFVDGFYITGDLGRVIPPGNLMSGQLMLTGRAKDTIVLTGGENVSPQPIEDALCGSPLIKHAMLLGQDKRTLGCLISLDTDAFNAHMQERGDERTLPELSKSELRNALLVEARRLNDARPDKKVWEVITEVVVVREPFSVENGSLTRTMKLRRPVVAELYAKDIEAVMSRLR